IPTLSATRIYKGQQGKHSGEEDYLSFEKFPHVGLAKTYNVNKQVPDSAGTGTAFLCGVKTNFRVLGVDARVTLNDCTTMHAETKLQSIVNWAQDKGKRTGVVTSTRITHATPAATYAHTANRDWESNGNIDEDNTQDCPDMKDIARQLVEDEPGNNLNVILGGGFQCFDANVTEILGDPFDKDCARTDNRVLWKDWIKQKKEEGVSHKFIRTLSELNQVSDDTDYLFGLFSNGHMPYEHAKKINNMDIPTLPEMTEKAIKLLSKGDKGYFLLLEPGHLGRPPSPVALHLGSSGEFQSDDAVKMEPMVLSTHDDIALALATTSDMCFFQHMQRNVLGLAAFADDDLPYTTLMYANGPGYNYTVAEGIVTRWNLTEDTVKDWTYTQQAAVPLDKETHGGDDVAIYATGPMAHLFHSLHEQNYIAHAMAYAACIGDNLDHCRSSATTFSTPTLMIVTLPVILYKYFVGTL
ncbi:unnamed protein product, partial [Meganyctiphanes norvegica]